MGNKFIVYQKKILIFQNWINSDILFVSDLLDNENKLNSTHIYNKLKDKRIYWMSEYTLLLEAIPKEWTSVLKQDISLKTKVRIQNVFWILAASSFEKTYICFNKDFDTTTFIKTNVYL